MPKFGKHSNILCHLNLFSEDKIIFSSLKSLSLEFLIGLKSFCSWNFTLEFPSLEELTVFSCPNIKIFSRGNLTTPKLQKVEIDFKSVKYVRMLTLTQPYNRSMKKRYTLIH
ncbi:hypothetical protein ACOSP7_013807 [Xanthoceras sorbifolium]